MQRWQRAAMAAMVVGTVLLVAAALRRGATDEGALDVGTKKSLIAPAPKLGSEDRNGRREGLIARGVSDRRLSAVTPNYDPRAFEGVKPKKRYEFDVDRWDEIEHLVGWSNSMATFDRWGCQLAHCRVKHQRGAFQSGKCELFAQVYMQEAMGEAQVTRVDYRVDSPDDQPHECFAYAECVRKAWLGRPAKLPKGEKAIIVDDYVFAPRFRGHNGDMTTITDDEFREAYARHREHVVDDRLKRSEYFEAHRDELSKAQQVGFFENLAKEAAEIVDAELMLLSLEGGLEGCIEGVEARE